MTSRIASLASMLFALCLTLWITALGAAGVTAAFVFATLPDLHIAIPAYEAFQPGDPKAHGLLASGKILERVFTAADFAQFALVPLTLLWLIASIAARRAAGDDDSRFRRPGNIVRLALTLLAAGLFTIHAAMLAPRFNRHLRSYWAAAQAGQHDSAAVSKAEMDLLHPRMSLILQTNFVLLLVVAGMSGWMSVSHAPSRRLGQELDEPLLARPLKQPTSP